MPAISALTMSPLSSTQLTSMTLPTKVTLVDSCGEADLGRHRVVDADELGPHRDVARHSRDGAGKAGTRNSVPFTVASSTEPSRADLAHAALEEIGRADEISDETADRMTIDGDRVADLEDTARLHDRDAVATW